MQSLKEILNKIEEKISLYTDKPPEPSLNWQDYDFGKNFYHSVIRTDEQTEEENEFIINKLNLKKNSRVLDLGCGGGRNSIPLAEEAFKVTGIDLNAYAIEEARKNSNDLEIEFIKQDILDINYNNCFEAVLMIFDHFSVFNKTEARKLLQKISKALVRDGKLLIETASVSFGANISGFQEWQINDRWLSGENKQLVLSHNHFYQDKKIHLRTDYCINADDNSFTEFHQLSQLYLPEELHSMLKAVDLKLVQIFSDWQGTPFEEGDERMIILAKL